MTHEEKILKHYKGKRGVAQEFLEALRLLLDKYERGDLSALCPLCEVEMGCDSCPWRVLLQSKCDYMENIFSSGRASKRMEQIRRWIKAYEVAIEKL